MIQAAKTKLKDADIKTVYSTTNEPLKQKQKQKQKTKKRFYQLVTPTQH